MKEFFKVEDLCFGYLKKPLCLKDVNFCAKKNDRVLVLGLNDKGKTSLLKTISGFDEKFFGKVFFEGKEVRSIEDNKKSFSLIFDEPVLLSSTVEKNIDFLYKVLGTRIPLGEEKEKLLEKFSLQSKIKKHIKKLSVFERFKLCFLRCYIKQSRVMFIDNFIKHGFSESEKQELKIIFDKVAKDKLVFLALDDNSFLENKEFLDWFNPTKVLYVNNAKVLEFESIEEFLEKLIDLDSSEFRNDLSKVEGYCVFQDSSYYLSFEEKIVIKIDKKLNGYFEKVNLSEGENEDITMVFEKDLQFDLTNNEEINKLLYGKKLKVFSKLDRSRII